MATAALALPLRAQAATLSDSVTTALTTHPEIEMGKAQQSAAEKNVWEQKAGFFPTIGVSGNAGREHADNSTTRGIAGPSGATGWVDQGRVSMTQPIFAGFGGIDRVHAAQDRYDAAKFDLGNTSEDLALRAARAHLNLMRTKELLDIASGYYTEIESRHQKIGLMVKEGAAEEAEQLQAEDILMSAKNTRLGYEEAWHQAEADYIAVVGHAPDTKLEFGTASWDALVPANVDEAVHIALDNNPRVMAADKMVSALGKEADATRADLVPRVDAELTYDHKNQGADMGDDAEDAAALVRMSWEFSTGGAQFARSGRADAARLEALARRHTAAREIEHDVRQKFTSMQIVDEQFGLLTAREEAVNNILSSTLKQFEAGKQSNLQIISAHAKLFDAKAARTDAFYRKLLSRFELLSNMGRLRQTFGVAEVKAEKPTSVLHVWRN